MHEKVFQLPKRTCSKCNSFWTEENVTVNKKIKSHHDATACYIYEKKFAKDKNYRKVRGYCHYTGKNKGTTHSICNVRFILSNGSIYNYHFIIKVLAKEFKDPFECLGEYKIFSVLMEK